MDHPQSELIKMLDQNQGIFAGFRLLKAGRMYAYILITIWKQGNLTGPVLLILYIIIRTPIIII